MVAAVEEVTRAQVRITPGFLVSMDAAATVTVPLTSPSADRVPFPLTSPKIPLT